MKKLGTPSGSAPGSEKENGEDAVVMPPEVAVEVMVEPLVVVVVVLLVLVFALVGWGFFRLPLLPADLEPPGCLPEPPGWDELLCVDGCCVLPAPLRFGGCWEVVDVEVVVEEEEEGLEVEEPEEVDLDVVEPVVVDPGLVEPEVVVELVDVAAQDSTSLSI